MDTLCSASPMLIRNGVQRGGGASMCCRRAVSDNAAVGGAQATFAALQTTYDFLTPDLWQETSFQKQPLQEFTDFLAKCVCTSLLPAACVVLQGII